MKERKERMNGSEARTVNDEHCVCVCVWERERKNERRQIEGRTIDVVRGEVDSVDLLLLARADRLVVARLANKQYPKSNKTRMAECVECVMPLNVPCYTRIRENEREDERQTLLPFNGTVFSVIMQYHFPNRLAYNWQPLCCQPAASTSLLFLLLLFSSPLLL